MSRTSFNLEKNVEIDFNDIINYLENIPLTTYEQKDVFSRLQDIQKLGGEHTVMDEIASEELQELINNHGANDILNILKKHL